MSAQRIDGLIVLAHEQVPRPQHHGGGLLLGWLDRDKAHGFAADRLADGLSISSGGLAALYVGLHVAWWHEPHLVTKACDLPRP